MGLNPHDGSSFERENPINDVYTTGSAYTNSFLRLGTVCAPGFYLGNVCMKIMSGNDLSVYIIVENEELEHFMKICAIVLIVVQLFDSCLTFW